MPPYQAATTDEVSELDLGGHAKVSKLAKCTDQGQIIDRYTVGQNYLSISVSTDMLDI